MRTAKQITCCRVHILFPGARAVGFCYPFQQPYSFPLYLFARLHSRLNLSANARLTLQQTLNAAQPNKLSQAQTMSSASSLQLLCYLCLAAKLRVRHTWRMCNLLTQTARLAKWWQCARVSSLCAYLSVCEGGGGQIMQMCVACEQGILQIRNVCQCAIKRPHGRLSGRGLCLCLSLSVCAGSTCA